ncbi:MAG TPA: DNA polymerase III subunit delta [Thermoguttaceae bacterium]
MAGKSLHALEYISQAEKYPPQAVCAVFGDDLFLRRQALLKLREAVLGGEEGDFSFTAFEGDKANLRDVLDELDTVAMFGGKRLVAVEEADDFVSHNRQQLEDYVSRPSRMGVLVLDLDSFPANTRLYKLIDAQGLLIDCSTPAEARLTKWLVDWAKQQHNIQISAAAADALVELVGPELGLLDQEVAKLVISVGEEKRITPELVGRYVGSWRAKTAWEMLDAALDGNVREALRQLDRLMTSGEQPVGILGQISASLRRFAAATRLVLQAETAGRRISLSQALERAGVKQFVLQKAERQLRRLGRQRGAQLYQWLLETDLDLKGQSAMPARLIVERLILRLAAPQEALSVLR